MSLRLITWSHSFPFIQHRKFRGANSTNQPPLTPPHRTQREEGADDGVVPPQFAWTEGADGHRRSRKLIGVVAPVSGEVRGGSCFKGEADQCS